MKEGIKNFIKNNFSYKGKEKLSKVTILFIITLDIFVFITLGLGIDFQIKVLNNPHVVYPNQCRTIINSKDLDNINSYFYSSNNFNSKYQTIKDEQMDERCNTLLYKKLTAVKKEHDILTLRKEEKRVLNKLSNVSKELNYLRENYNTVLFEKISSQNIDKSIVKDNISSENIKARYDTYLKQTEELKKEKEKLLKSFSNSKSVNALKEYATLNKVSINKDYKKATKSYNIKKELVTIAFLLPLLFVSFYLMRRYLVHEKYTLYIMFKNILVVVFIPLFVSFVSLIYILIPKVFLERVVRFFYELDIPFIVYYIVIAIFIILFGYIIVKIQKKYKEDSKKFSKNSITQIESYNRNICNVCGNNVNYETMNYCPCCKNKLKMTCKICGEKTINGLKYCINCGVEALK